MTAGLTAILHSAVQGPLCVQLFDKAHTKGVSATVHASATVWLHQAEISRYERVPRFAMQCVRSVLRNTSSDHVTLVCESFTWSATRHVVKFNIFHKPLFEACGTKTVDTKLKLVQVTSVCSAHCAACSSTNCAAVFFGFTTCVVLPLSCRLCCVQQKT
eukprot:2037-Heterococcus_DN1.PRE.1